MICVPGGINEDEFSINDILSSIQVTDEIKVETVIIKETYLLTDDQVITFFSELKIYKVFTLYILKIVIIKT